jgi:metal-responsive CopG/Arc/MetJ family transcriptional regulator
MKKQNDTVTIKTTINVDKELWKKFNIKVIEKHGGRKMNDVIAQLLRQYLE